MERAQEIFSKLDTDNGGDITEAEFIKVCLEELLLPVLFVPILHWSWRPFRGSD